jgi:hypothetical protein
VKTTVTLDKRKARQLGWDQQVAEPKFLQLDALGLFESAARVRSAINGVTVDLFAQDHAAERVDRPRGHEQCALPIELISGRQSAIPPPTTTTGTIEIHPSIITFADERFQGRDKCGAVFSDSVRA